MRQIDLKEYVTSEHTLSATERDTLQKSPLSLTFQPVVGTDRTYRITPGSIVGAVDVGDLSVLIEPKICIPRLLSLVCYAMGAFRPQRQLFDYPHEYALPDVLALSLFSAARRAFSRGLLHGYLEEDDALHTVRGRVRFGEQMRRRFGVALPVEVRYDEFTDDILANRLVKAATLRLGGMRLRSKAARIELGRIAGTLDNVSLVEFSPLSVPEVRFDRLNEHYREVVSLSRLILRQSAFEFRRGEVRASGFLVDMNVVFQEFVTQALREQLGVSRSLFLERYIPSLDRQGRVKLKPDLTWWHGRDCLFVGDAKYKVAEGRVHHDDLYQLLAYVTALDLPGGMLIYAKGEAEQVVHEVRRFHRRLEIAALDLSRPLNAVLKRVDEVARRVERLRDDAKALRHSRLAT